MFSHVFSMCTGLDLLGVAMIESIEAPQRFEGEEEVEEVEEVEVL